VRPELTDFKDTLREVADEVTAALERLLPTGDGPEARVFEAMGYATLNGGKRLRPFLVLSGASLFQVPRDRDPERAVAAEFAHCYSLVHDDLPSMDDDDLRRGQPTCHIKYDEATAILAGDALLTHAFEILSDVATHPNAIVRCELVQALAAAIGARGMVGGQMFDLSAGEMDLDIGAVTRLQQMKTGALIAFSCEAGAILGRATKEERQALRMYAHDVGLAFQIADDLLDEEGTEEEVGKKVGKDADAGKATFVSLLGAERARSQADMLANQAAKHLDLFGGKADLLCEVARFIVERRA
jgi:farnesyl diphosphate synthase